MSNQENGPGIPHPSRADDRKMLIAYLTEHADVVLETESKDMPVRGNASAWGDGTDDAYADELIARISRGDEYAWFCANVTARLDQFEGSDCLGGCTYDSEKQFREDGYYTDMVSNAIEALADDILSRAYPVAPKPDPSALAYVETARATSHPSNVKVSK